MFSYSAYCSGRSIVEKNALLKVYWCDFGFKSSSKLHRCSKCLTKLYCGKACIDEDWPIHKLVCVKDLRKRKDGESARDESIIESEVECRNYLREYMKSLM